MHTKGDYLNAPAENKKLESPYPLPKDFPLSKYGMRPSNPAASATAAYVPLLIMPVHSLSTNRSFCPECSRIKPLDRRFFPTNASGIRVSPLTKRNYCRNCPAHADDACQEQVVTPQDVPCPKCAI